MSNPKIVLDTVNVLTNPVCFNLFQMIAKKQINYTDLIANTNLSSHSLSKNLESLLQYSLVKTDFGGSDEGKFTTYKITEVGKKFQNILHDVISDFDDVPQEVTGKFVLDATSFWKLYDKMGITTIKEIFRDVTIIFTDSDFETLVEHAEKIKSDLLEDFLYDEKEVIVAKSYQNPTNGTRTEFYLRRAKKLSQEKAQLISTALDLKAGIILSDKKVIKYARQFGILSTDVEKLFKLEKDALIEKFYEFATTKDDTSPMEVINPQYYTKALKKN